MPQHGYAYQRAITEQFQSEIELPLPIIHKIQYVERITAKTVPDGYLLFKSWAYV